VAECFNATPFDIEGTFWSRRGDTCTFDTMIEEFGLKSAPVLQLAKIVRGADAAPPRPCPAIGWAARRLAWLFPHVSGRSPVARRRDVALRRVLPLVPRRVERNAQLTKQQALGLMRWSLRLGRHRDQHGAQLRSVEGVWSLHRLPLTHGAARWK
jgi:hypothetical protein